MKAALITGGTSGIGLATARRLAGKARLALIYSRDAERAQAAEEALPDCRAFCVDVGDSASVAEGYARVVEHFGQPPQILVNSAGVARFQAFFVQGRGLELLEEMMNINYFGCLRVIEQVFPSMYRRKEGIIVNIASISALGGNQGVIGYAEAKAALICLTKNLAMEGAHRGISVNAVSPGRVQTPMTSEFLEQFRPASINAPLGRPLDPDEVARVVEFLISMGPAVNGQNWIVDGGTSLARPQAR